MSRNSSRKETYTSDESWSDVEDNKDTILSQSHSSSPRQLTPRKRRGRSNLTQRKQTSFSHQQRQDKSDTLKRTFAEERKKAGLGEDITKWGFSSFVFVSRYIADILSTVIHLLRKPFALLIFFFVLAKIMSGISSTLRTVMSPLCILPGFSSSHLCGWNPERTGVTRWVDFPTLMDVQSKTFEQLLDESSSSTGLSLEIKKAEMATSDLISLVRVSNLRSKDMLSQALDDFVKDARKTGRGLQKLHAKVGGAVDSIMAVNDWALHTIDASQSQKSRFDIINVISGKQSPTTEAVTETFTEAMNTLSIYMRRLILEAEVNIANLEELEERMSTVHDLIAREGVYTTSAKEELLSELWTKLGGNRKTLRGFNQHLSLLKDVGEYRKQALVHVVTSLHALQLMSENMEDLRERAAAPELVGSKIPVDVHMKSIKNGLERLKEGRTKAKGVEEATVKRLLGISSSEEIDGV